LIRKERKKERKIRIIFSSGSPQYLNKVCSRRFKESNSPVVGLTVNACIYNSKILSQDDFFYSLNLPRIQPIVIYAKGNSKKVGTEIAESLLKLQREEKLNINDGLLLLLSDGTNTDGELLINRISELCPEIAIAGGMASAEKASNKTAVFCNGELIEEGAVGIFLYNENLRIFQSYLFDWEEFGDYHLITDSKNNRVFTIDGIPAVDFYGEILGEEVKKSLPDVGIEYPLVIRKGNLKIARACIKRFHDGSLAFAGHLTTGEKVKLSAGNLRSFFTHSEELKNLKSVAEKSEQVFIFSCVARKNFLKELAETELLIFKNVPNIGFFTHGEFFKRKNEEGLLLNETLTIAGITKKEVRNPIPNVNERTIYPFNPLLKDYIPIFHSLRRLSKESSLLKEGLSNTKVCIIILERKRLKEWFCSFVSENVKDILGIEPVEIKAKRISAEFILNNVVLPEDKLRFKRAFNKLLRRGETEVDYRIRRNNEIRWIRSFVKLIHNENTNILVHVHQDITSDKELELMAEFDPLTGLYNRRVLERLDQKLKKKNVYNALFFIDIDKFKQINDIYGHDIGDKVLNFVAKCIENSIRKDNDVALRYAGDEFVVVLHSIGSSKEEALKKTEEIAERILSEVKKGQAGLPYVSISIGIKVFKNIKIRQALTIADKTMYEAKEAGGRRYKIAEVIKQPEKDKKSL